MAKVTADSTEASAGRCGSPLRGASHAASSERRQAAALALCHGAPPTERLKDRPVLLEVDFCAMDDRPQCKSTIALVIADLCKTSRPCCCSEVVAVRDRSSERRLISPDLSHVNGIGRNGIRLVDHYRELGQSRCLSGPASWRRGAANECRRMRTVVS